MPQDFAKTNFKIGWWVRWGSIMLCFLPLATYALTPTELQERIKSKEKDIAQLQAEADTYRKSINETAIRAKTLKGEIARIDNQVKQLNYNLAITQKKLEATELKIQGLELNIQDTNTTISNRRNQIGATLQAISEFDFENLLATFLKSDRLSDFFSHTSYLTSLEDNLHKELLSLQELDGQLKSDLGVSEATKREFQALSRSLNNQKRIAADKKQERADLLSETKNQEQNYQHLLQETTKKQQVIEHDIFDLESELRRQIIAANLPGKTPGLFIVPVDNGYVTQEFGPTTNDATTKDFYKFHNGIDFGSQTGVGTPIRAAMDGTVQAVGNNGRYAYGKWVAVRHTNGLITLYAHLSLVAVTTGASVHQGDTIGYMGQTGLATGPHLHFGVYATDTFHTENRWFGLLPVGGSVNPRDYLPAI